ncbi:MAG: accessory gene regulator B family protein [Clostridia bacterium]|nr:accessory gene regulator B family protein [Clostridia bacterium]
MNFIKKWSYGCANFLTRQLDENHQKRGVYYYGFQIVIGAIVKSVLLISIALILRSLIPTLIVLGVFGTLRMLAGGYHMDTYGKCIITSLGLMLASGVITQYTYKSWQVEYVIALLIISFLAGLIVSIKWAPADTPNKPITKPEEIKKFKVLSIIYMMVFFAAGLILIYNNYTMFVIAGCLGLLLEAYTVTPMGYRFFDKISGEVDKISNTKHKKAA